MAGQHGNRILRDEDVGINGGASDLSGDHAVVLEDVHCAFDEDRNHLEIELPRHTHLGRKRGNSRIDVGVVQHAWVDRVVPDDRNWVEHHHGPHVRDAHVTDMKGGCVQARGPGMEVDRQVGIGFEQSVEHQSGLAANGTEAVFIAGPGAVHVIQLHTAPATRPTTLHAFHCRTRNIGNRHDSA